MAEILTKEFLKEYPFEVGDFTYGNPQIHWWGEPATLKIGKFCSIANGVKIILGGNHRTDWITTYPFSGRSLRALFPEAESIIGHPTSKGDIVIGNDVWIGMDAKVMSGVTIGDGAVIAAGAVVTSSVNPYEIVGGNPAKHIGYRFETEVVQKLLAIRWWDRDEAWIRSNISLLMSRNVDALIAMFPGDSLALPWKPVLRRISKVHFEIVKGCQLKCIGCPNSTLSPRVERISPDFFDRCLRQIDVEEIGLLRLFNFGEPLLHHDLDQILLKVGSAPQKIREVEISTNGQFVKWDQFERALATGVLTRIAISCDGDGTPAEFERLRPPSRWEKLIEFLEKTRELRDRLAPSLQLVTRTVINSAADKARWNALLIPLGWRPEFRTGMALPEATVSLSPIPVQLGTGVCSFLKDMDRLYVDWDGTVVPCCAHPRAGMLGNLSITKYSSILSGKEREGMAATMGERRAEMPVCRECVF